MKGIVAALATAVWLAGGGAGFAQSTLEKVKGRGTLVCGGSQGVTGFSAPDQAGIWKGFDVDWCRARTRSG